MTAEEIRNFTLDLEDALVSVEGQRIFMMLQIAQLLREGVAQLADLNQQLRHGTTSIETHSLDGDPR